MKWDTTLYDPEDSSFNDSDNLSLMLRTKIAKDTVELEDEYDVSIEDEVHEDIVQLYDRLVLKYGYIASILLEFMFQVFREHNEEVYEIIVHMNHDEDYVVDQKKIDDICTCAKCQHALAIMKVIGDMPVSVNCLHDQEDTFEKIPENIEDFLGMFGVNDVE